MTTASFRASTLDELYSLNTENVTSQLEVSKFYVIATHIWKAIDVVGLIGNLLCLLVMTRKGMRHLPFAPIAAVLAVSDSCVLVNNFLYNVDLSLPDLTIVTSYCELELFWYFFFSVFSSWCLVCITFERFIAVVWPLNCHIIISRKKAALILSVIATVLILLDLHVFWNTDQDSYGACVWKEEFYLSLFHTIYTWVDISLFSIVPFILILTLNCLIICKLCRTEMGGAKALNNQKQRDIVFTLFGVSLAFISLTSPMCIYTLKVYIMGQPFDVTSTWAIIGYVLQETNFAINFYIYCLTGNRVRQELKSIFSCTDICRKDESVASNTSSTVASVQTIP